MNKIHSIDDDNFTPEVLESESPVLVEFGATWCGPCKTQLPILQLLKDTFNTLKVVKVDIDDSPSTTNKYNVKAVPTLLFIKDGVVLHTKVGLSSLNDLTKLVLSNFGEM
jgi:thioredoxin 1